MDLKKKMKAFFTLKRHANEGFTLVELIVVIAILAILAGIAVPAYSGYVDKAKMAADQQLLATMNTAFTVACMDNKQYDMTAISPTPTATIASDGTVTVDPYNDTFQTYFGGGTFQYYDKLYFNSDKGVFEPRISNFAGAGVMEQMEQTLKGIGGYFADAIDQGLTGENLKTFLTSGMNDDLINGLGLNGMIDGYNEATSYTDEELRAMYGEDLTDEELKTLRGNLGMMYFANDAASRSTEEVMTSVDQFIAIMQAGKYNTESVTFDQLEDYYLETATDAEKAAYYSADTTRKQEIINEFRDDPEAIAINADVKYSGAQAVAMAQAAKDMENKAGVTTLSSMYALAAGYFNSDYYNPETDGSRPSSYGDFESVNKAMNTDSFFEYVYGAQGQADLEYYLDYMKSLSENPNVDLTDPDIFAGLNGKN